jgi:putative membrane protein
MERWLCFVESDSQEPKYKHNFHQTYKDSKPEKKKIMNSPIIDRVVTKQKTNLIMLQSFALILASIAVAAVRSAHAEDKASAPTDAQIAMIVVVADTVDVNYGKLAVKRTSNQAVKEFAETMVRDHTAVNEKAIALAKKLGVTPEATDTSKSLQSNGEKELAKLKALTGAEFDKAYVDNEVSYHEAVIGLLDKTLVPHTSNAELKSLLESGRPIFVAHLEHAKKLQASLRK